MRSILRRNAVRWVAVASILSGGLPVAFAQDQGSAADVAKALANPVAALISVPLQANFDDNLGPLRRGSRFTLNIQPVIPVSLSSRWNLISRTILPVISQDAIFPGAGSQSGLGDAVQSLFLSPKEPTSRGWIWGVGPVLALPTATDALLGSGKWGAGPTVVMLRQVGPWTYGALLNQIWSFAGQTDRSAVSSTFIQPFLTYTTPTAWSFSANTESTYDWHSGEWSAPVIVAVSKVLRLGGQMFSLQAGPRYYAAHRRNGPEGWAFRVTFTLLFPKKPAAGPR